MTHPAIVDDSSSGTDGTVWNDAWETAHDTAIDAAIAVAGATVRPVTAGGTGVATLAAHGVLIGEGASAVAVTGAGTTGQVLTSNGASADPTFQAVPYPFGATGTSAPTTTGTSTALAIPTGTGNLALFLNNATLLTIQGIAAGLDGQLLTLHSKGAGQVDLAHLHASGTALGKLKLFATSGLTSLAPGVGVAVLQYDSTVTQWRLVSHDQGAWITPTFAGGDYTGDGTISWTVDAGDVTTAAYLLEGRKITVAFFLITTSTGGAASTGLRRTIPGGFTATKTMGGAGRVQDAGATRIGGMLFVLAAGTFITFSRIDFANWSNAAVNNTEVFGSLSFEVN